MVVALAGIYLAGAISVSVPKNPAYRLLVRLGIMIGLRKQRGYLRPVSADTNTVKPEDWQYEAGQIRAVSYTLVVVAAYCTITTREIAPLVALMLLLSLGVLILTGVTFFWDRYRLPLLAILVAYFWLAGFCAKADHYYRVWTRPVPEPELTPCEIVGRAGQQHLPIVIVAAAGGGIQSAAWTTSVLNQLGKRLAAEPGGGYDLPHSVRLISGVSGGSVGGMFYAEGFSETKPDFRHSFQAACSSGLGPTIRGLLRQDLWRALAPFLVNDICDDRGLILERQWCRNFDEKFKPNAKLADATLSGWGADALSLKRPALVLNSTIVETGERLAISTVPIGRGLIGETEFTKRYCAEIAISTAARVSATFPIITPTGRPTMQNQNTGSSIRSAESTPPCGGGDQHSVDGGYYENSGVVGAIEWIDDALTDLTDPKKNPNHYPLPRNILLLTIDAFERPTDPEDPDQPVAAGRPADTAHGVLYNLVSPLNAVMNVRGSGQRSFARRLLRMSQRRWALENVNIRDVKIFFEVKDPENREEHVGARQKKQALAGKKPAGPFYIGVDPGKEPLSWHLRPVEINELRKEWVGFSDFSRPDNYQVILDFFKAESAKQ
jgi:predicted acylesterase/phospholipase RssA